MKVAPIICLLLLTCNLWVFSQEEDSNTFKNYKNFLETFHSELDEYSEPISEPDSPYIVTNPEPLPYFFSSIPNSVSSTIYAVGISDPFMAREEGRKLALLRAKSMLAIQKASVVKHMSDYFINEHINNQAEDISGKYIDFYMVTSALIYDSADIDILADTVNRYGETMMLVKFTPAPNHATDTLISIGECLSSEIRDNSRYEVNHRIELRSENKSGLREETDNFNFISLRVQKTYEVNSTFQGKKIAPPSYTLRYKSTVEEIPGNSHVSYLTNGLWNAFVEAFFKHLFIQAKMYATRVKTTGDYHSYTTKNLNREITRSQQYFRLDKVNILENRMYVNVNFLNE